jgi:hypothetical protein
MGKLKRAGPGADPRDFNLNFFINLPRSSAMSFDTAVWRCKPSDYFRSIFNDFVNTF